MPIDYKKYHPLWKRISRFVRLIRAGNSCEECGVRNYTVRHYEDNRLIESEPFESFREARHYANNLNNDYVCTPELGHRWTVVILTVAHLDHDVANNELDNLKALCQGCHLGHDRKDNAQRRMYGPTGRYFGQLKLL
jgi:hypothetical protein